MKPNTYYATHRKERLEYVKEYRKNNKERLNKAVRDARSTPEGKKRRQLESRMRKYRLSLSEAKQTYLASSCEICGNSSTKLVVDHDHSTGQVRGMLCHSCNIGLGFFRDSLERMENAVIYINKFTLT